MLWIYATNWSEMKNISVINKCYCYVIGWMETCMQSQCDKWSWFLYICVTKVNFLEKSYIMSTKQHPRQICDKVIEEHLSGEGHKEMFKVMNILQTTARVARHKKWGKNMAQL